MLLMFCEINQRQWKIIRMTYAPQTRDYSGFPFMLGKDLSVYQARISNQATDSLGPRPLNKDVSSDFHTKRQIMPRSNESQPRSIETLHLNSIRNNLYNLPE